MELDGRTAGASLSKRYPLTERRTRPPRSRVILFAAQLLWLSAEPVSAQSTPTAEYEVTFDATWSAATHSVPPSPHFSGLIGGTHNGLVSFWNVGALASSGIKSMAETGSKLMLTSEVNAAIGAGTADALLSGGGISPSPGSVSITFTAHESYPLLSLVAMVAPSPDWFVGVSALDLIDGGDWVAEKVIQLNVYDAGTDSGITFTAPNLPTIPPIPVALFDSGPFAGSMQYVGTYTITRTDEPPPAPPAQLPALHAPAIWVLAGGMLLLGRRVVRKREDHPRTR